MDYCDKIEALKLKYEPRILEIMKNLAEAFRAEGFEPMGIVDLCDDEYRWAFEARLPGKFPEREHHPSINISFEIVEQRENDGEGQGVTFRIDLTGVDNECLGGNAPFNYTEQCWVDIDDAEAVEARFKLVETADPYECVSLVGNLAAQMEKFE